MRVQRLSDAEERALRERLARQQEKRDQDGARFADHLINRRFERMIIADTIAVPLYRFSCASCGEQTASMCTLPCADFGRFMDEESK